MRFTAKHFIISLILLLFCGWAVAATSNPPETVFSEKQIIEAWGWTVAHDREVAGIEINDDELQAFLKGVTSALHSQQPPFALGEIFPDVQTLAVERQKKAVLAAEQKNTALAGVFFDGLNKDTNIVRLSDGLNYEIIAPSTGALPKPEQTVDVHFTGRLIDGTEFIQIGPSDMILVSNRVNRGLFEGIQKINAGGSIKIFVPPALAKDDWEKMGTPPGSAMIFDVELFAVKETAPQDLADALAAPAPELPPNPLSGKFTAQQIIETWGWNIAQQTRVASFHLTDSESAAFLKGLSNGVQGLSSPFPLEKIYPAVEQFVSDRRQKADAEFKQKQLEQDDEFFADLKKKTNVVFLPDGLAYEILQAGTGAFPQTNQIAKVNYTGRLISGRIFDATDPSLGPLDIDPNTVIVGWREGIRKINRGGKIRLYIPPALGYGEASTSGIPPYSTLIFEIELLSLSDLEPTTSPENK